MNILNFLLNISLIPVELKELSIYHFIFKIFKNGIAFISNMENVMMGDYYIMEYIKKENNLKLKENANFKILINNYILKDYYISNINNANLVRENEIISIIKFLFLNLENLLIGSQKFIYEYVNYLKHLFNWYHNFKILIDKNIINSNIKEELYYNISLELLSEAQSEYNKAFWWTIKNSRELKKNVLIQIFKNYFRVFKENPYKITIELMNLYKDYLNINLLNYGLNYDINILTHNKHVLSNLNIDILPAKNNFIYTNKVLQGMDKKQYFIFKNTSVWNKPFKKKDFNILLGTKFNDYIVKFIDDKWNASGNFLKKTYTLTRLKLLNNRFFNFDFLKNSILASSFSNYNSKLKWDIPYPSKIILHKVTDCPYNFTSISLRWDYYTWHQPDRILRYYLQSIIKFLIGVDEDFVDWRNVTNVVKGRRDISNINNISDIKKISDNDLKTSILDLYKLRKLYGGYTYWWAWHQDASFLHPEKFAKIGKDVKRPRFYVIGKQPIFYTSIILPDIKLHLDSILINKQSYIMREITTSRFDTTTTELMDKVQQLNDMADLNSDYNKRKAEIAQPLTKKKPTVFRNKDIIAEEDVMLDTDINVLMKNKQKPFSMFDKKFSKVKDMKQYLRNVKKTDEYKKALEIEKIRNEKDPLHLSTKYKKARRFNYLTTIPDISTEKGHKEQILTDYIKIKRLVPSNPIKKLLRMAGVKKMDLWGYLTKYRKVRIVSHGNIGLRVTRNFFKTYLVADDIWVRFNFLKKKDLLERFKPYKVFKKVDYISKIETIVKRPSLKKNFGKFVSLDILAKHNRAYKKFIELELRPAAVQQAYINDLFKATLGVKGRYEYLIEYLKHGDIWDKKWLQEAKDVTRSAILSKMPEKVKYINRIEKFNFKNEDLLQLTVKYNTPMRFKKVPLNYHTKVIRSPLKLQLKYIVPYKLFEHYFYPEVSKKIKIIKIRKADLLFELNMTKKDFILNNIKFKTHYDYDLQLKFNLYENVIKRKFKTRFLKSKEMVGITLKGMRGFLMYRFNFDVFANADYLSTLDYFRKNSITWDNFYHTNIESVTEPLHLNIIHKNFYGKHANKGFNSFLYRKSDFVSDAILPKNRNILLKKTYIKNLIYVYDKEDRPLINYMLYIIKKEEFKLIHKFLINGISNLLEDMSNALLIMLKVYKNAVEFFLELIAQELLRFREARRLKKFIEQHPEFLTYIIISIIFFVYVIISIFLILVIKTFLPKNLIYGKLNDNEDTRNNLDLLHNNNRIENIKARNSENFIRTIYELENIMEIDLDKEKIHRDIKKDLTQQLNNIELNNITIENLKKLELYVKLKKRQKLTIKKNFFNAEEKYVYSWENKNFNLLEEIKKAKTLKKIVPLENKRFLKKRIYFSKFEENKVNDLNKKYTVFYKSFIFEKNLEKWENNTKRRLDFFFNKETKGIIRLLLTDLWRAFLDRRFNYNRMLFWNDPDLEDTSKITYMFAVYKPFFNIFFIIKFILGSLKLWDYNYWISKWKQYVMFGVHAKINYKDLRGRLEKEWSLEWYKDEADYGRLQFKDFLKIIKKYKDIKRLSLNKEVSDRKKIREELLDNILELTSEEDKWKEVNQYLSDLKRIESDRIAGSFEDKFNNIATKLIVDIDKIGPRKWAEQKLRFKYRNKVYEEKLKIEKEEYEVLKQSYTSRVKRNLQDKEKTLQTLQWKDDKKVKAIMKQKIAAIEYEKNLREYNYHNKFIDTGLDAKDKVFYEAIKEYNQELSDEYLKIQEEEKKEKLEENVYEQKSKKLLGILDQNYIFFRWFTTMGARFNYIFVLIIGIFIGWWDNVKRIRKNEHSLTSLFKIMGADLFKYIYKIYWEYLILWNRSKALKKLGFSIKEILKFSIILTPIFFYFTFLYSIFILYFLLIIILFIFPKKIYLKIKEKIKEKINKKINKDFIEKIINIIKNIANYFIYIWKIINLLFKDVETGDTLWIQLYNKFYKICGLIQYNIYMLKGAFILGYINNNENQIKNGVKSVLNWLKLKYNSYIEQKKDKKIFSRKIWKIKIIKLKENMLLKIQLLKIVLPIQPYFLKMRLKIWYYLYAKIGKRIFKVEREEFVKIYKKNIELFIIYYKNIIEFFTISFNNAQKLKLKDLIILIFKTILKTIWSLLILPFVFVINHQKWKYVKNYKQGIQGFRDNPMHLIIDNPKKKNDWKSKLHNILMEQEISYYLKNLLQSTGTLIDIFFIFKIHEVKWTNKNYFQDFFWRKWYWKYKKIKEYVLNYLIDIAMKLEENYASFEQNVETKNWSLWERFKYAYYTYKLYKHGMTRKSQQRKSRDLFFYKKTKEKKKIMRIYFIKGVINWITYITINKVIFTKIHNLKTKKKIYKYIKYKYKLKDVEAKIYINNNIHLTEELKNTPPQLWALIIMYDIYYRGLLRYRFEDQTYPKKWVENENLQYKKSYKWRLASPEHNYDIPFYDRRFIAADLNNYDFIEFVGTLASEPYDPLLRWIIFLLEYGMASEDVILAGEGVWVDGEEKDNFIWADISLTHLLTYNTELDEYKYEIKNFNRLMKGLDFLRVAENTLTRDKLKYYQDKYKQVANTIMMENEDILEDILKERRLVKAKMLHKALAHNRLKTKYEKDEETAKEQEREYYFTKKKEFFEELLIEEFWDWQAEYDEGSVEEKYFNSQDLFHKTYDAQIFEEYFLKNRRRLDYDYLLNHIILVSYDQTMEEIHYFLTFKVWKILEKTLKKDKRVIEINYKNLNISNEYLSRINYDQHVVLKTKKWYNEKEDKDEWEQYYEYKYNKLEWQSSKEEAIYGFMDNNVLGEYAEAGEYYTYEIKIEYNEEALKYARQPKIFHGQELLKRWMKMVSRRFKTLQNIKKKSIKKKKRLPLNIAYINNIKWTWEQWLIYTDVEIENELLNKNTVILNERFHLWNLKRVPVRVKLPVALTADLVEIKDYILDKSNYMSLMNHRHIMMLSDISPLLKQGLVWEQCKIMLEKRFNKNIQDLILWIFTAEIFNREMIKIKKDYQFVLKNFIQNYGVFHKLYFLGMPQYTWDLIRYHEAWWGRDEFPYDKYFQLKQIEFLNHDPAARRIVRHLYKLYLDKYSPASFVYFFKNQYFANHLYNIYGILSFSCFIWTLKILMYNPGEYISENYMLFTPMLLTLAFWFLRRSLKDVRNSKDGVEIYLYRHHSSKVMDSTELMYRKWRLEKQKNEWTEHFYDADKIQELFPNGIRSINTDLKPDWWRYHTHKNKNSKIYQYTHGVWWIWVFIGYFLSEYWRFYKFKYRNSWWLWDFYRYDEELIKDLRARGLISSDIRAPKNYKEKQWFIDSWARLENGGNWYSRWYENEYRKIKGLTEKPLDYGYDWQKIADVDTPIWINKTIYHFPGAVADINWIVFSRYVEYYNQLPEEYKDLTKALNITRKKIIKTKYIKAKKPKDKRVLKREIAKDKQLYKEIFDDRMKYQNYDLEEELRNLEILKKSFIETKAELKEEFKRWYLGTKYIDKKHPLAKWGELLYWISDNVGFKTTENIYARFLLDSKKLTRKFLRKDLVRYTFKRDFLIEQQLEQIKIFIDNNLNIFKYIKGQEIKRNKEILLIKSKCFYKGEKMDMRTLLSISEMEIHVANLRYFLLKSKQYRILKKLIKEKKYYIDDKLKINFFKKYTTIHRNAVWELKIYDTISRWSYFDIIKKGMKMLSSWARRRTNVNYYKFRLKKMREIELYKALYEKTAKKLKRYNNYLLDLPKRLEIGEKSEYRYNLIVNFFKEKKDLWIFIRDFFSEMSLLEWFAFIVKIIWKIFE